MALMKRGLGRGLSALIPDEEMELFRRVARDQAPVAVATSSDAAVKLTKKVRGQSIKKNAQASDSALLPPSEIIRAKTSPASLENLEDPINVIENGANALSGFDGGAESDSVFVANNSHKAIQSNMVELADIEANPYQPRRTFDEAELDNLAASLREHGVIQPIVVRPLQNGPVPYQLVAGERRWRAAQRAGMQSIPAIIRPVDDLQSLELALIENVQRHDISAIDAALAYRRLADEFHLSQEHIANRVGKSRSAVANTMRLLDLQPEIRKAIEDGHLSEGHGRAILLAQGEGSRRALFRRTMRDHLSVREVERSARETTDSGERNEELLNNSRNSSPSTETEPSSEKKRHIEQLEARLQKKLGARAKLKSGARGGRIVIEYSSETDLQRLFDLLMAG